MQPQSTIPLGLCQCGCGRHTSVARCSDRTRGWVKGRPLQYALGHSARMRIEITELANPSGLCQCGCGQHTAPAAQGWRSEGYRRGDFQRYVNGHNAHAVNAARRQQFAATFARRFWERVDKNGPLPANRPELGPCWLWRGSILADGYGQVKRAHKTLKAHRVAWELLSGPVPDELELDHLCRVRLCVNTAHLEPVPGAENNRRSESPSAQNARKTHCAYGHPLSGDNLFYSDGRRQCRICHRRRGRETRERRRANYP